MRHRNISALSKMKMMSFEKSSIWPCTTDSTVLVEKIDPNQIELFEEAEKEEESSGQLEETTEIASYQRKKVGRKALDESLPRKEILLDIPEEEKICGCGTHMDRIGEDVGEELEIIPEQVYVKRRVRPKYGCRHCEGSGDEDKPAVRQAPSVARLLPGSIVSPALMAFILTNKFIDHLPFYRQENTKKSYMWLARGGPPDAPMILYRYHTGRDSAYIKDFLIGFTGYLQTDGFSGYATALKENDQVAHVGCLAHLRRKFHDATKASKSTGAHIALKKIQQIYQVEKELSEQGLSEANLISARKEGIEPLLVDFKNYLDKKIVQVRPSSLFGKALSYAQRQWERVARYVESPYLTPDNNAAERSIRPFVMGRKNWLFSGSPMGADASCFFYSLIETAKENQINPYGYLKWVFETAPMIPKTEYETLLPWNCDRNEVNRFTL